MSYSKRRELFSMYRQSVDSLPRNDKKYIINSSNNIISTSDIDGFLLMFKTKKSVNDVFVFFKNIGQPILDSDDIPLTLKNFYKKYCCDLDWAKNEDYCKVASTGDGGGNTGGGNTGGGNTGGGGSVSQGWLADPTGNTTWEYQLRDCKWVARKIGKKTEYFISDNPKYQSSVDILNGKYPKLIKNCNKTNTDDKPEETKIETPTIVLPQWADCLKVLAKVKLSQDSKGEEVVISPFGVDSGYYWSDKTFLYIAKDGTKSYGKWACKNNVLVITTEDGLVWTSTSGWSVSPDKNENPDTNFFGSSETSWTTPDELSGAKSDSSKPNPFTELKSKFGEMPKIKIPEFKFGENKPMSLNQNESTMNNLENIINEVNTLIIEQTKEIPSVVMAPADELNALQTNALLKNAGTLETLCRTSNGTSKPVKVEGGKIYFAGKSFKMKDGTVGYLTYDGMILVRQGNSCEFKYLRDDKNVVRHIKGIPFLDLAPQHTNILSKFGINPLDYNSDPYYFIQTITNKFQKLINERGARSAAFKSWNDMLTYWDPTGTLRLKGVSGDTTIFMTYPPNDELSNYRVITGNELGIRYDEKDIPIYQKITSRVTNDRTANKRSPEACKKDLINYLGAAFEFQKEGIKDAGLDIVATQKTLQGCYRSGAFDAMSDIGPTDLNVEFTKKDNPFEGMRGFGNGLDIKEIKKILIGNTNKLPLVGLAGKNPYLNFYIDRRDMNESKRKLNSLIKENLQILSEQKSNNLLAETKIIQTRTKILTENRILEFKQPREKFFNEIISEAIYLESQGFDKQIIKEEFWDSIKGLFGQHGSEAIFGTFKEYMGKWLVTKLTPVNPEGWIGSIVVASIGNLHIDDISKLTDCSFLTKKLASSIGEGIARKIQHDKGYDGGISDVVRNGLFSAIDNTEMVKSLENGIAALICPSLKGVKDKIKNKAEQMKTMAVQA
jgi:hypothetical protein